MGDVLWSLKVKTYKKKHDISHLRRRVLHWHFFLSKQLCYLKFYPSKYT